MVNDIDYRPIIYFFDKIPGYNPPELYLKLEAYDTDVYALVSLAFAHTTGNFSFSNNIGTVKVDRLPILSQREPNYFLIRDKVNAEYYMCKIINKRSSSLNVFEFTIEIDWYTSQVINSLYMPYKYEMPTANTILYRRLTNGEFKYTSDNLPPLKITGTKKAISILSNNISGAMFNNRTTLLVYHNESPDVTCWIIENSTAESNKSPKDLWEGYQRKKLELGGTGTIRHPYNAKSVMYYGFIPISLFNLPWRWKKDTYAELNKVVTGEGSSGLQFTSSADDPLLIDGTLELQTPIRTTDWEEYKIRDIDGNVLFTFPNGVYYDRNIPVKIGVALDPVNPILTFTFRNGNNTDYINGQASFSIPFRPLTHYIDNLSVYNAEERVYNKEMRNLQATTNLVSGLTSAGTEGAMIGGFSRSSGITKGLLGAGVGGAGALLGYGYETMYANKEIERIESKKARLTADTLAMSCNSSYEMGIYIAGLWCDNYDYDTVLNIQSYHQRFGYLTNKIETNVALNTLTDYVQADIIFAGGIRKEIESYIQTMFNNGVRFNVL